MRDGSRITRRSLLTGGQQSSHHISSAVVVAFPAQREEIGKKLATLSGVEVHASDGSRIVVTIEGPSSGFLGETLINISLMDGVIAANMVFEHIEEDAKS
jgi:nitrate reductase NapD